MPIAALSPLLVAVLRLPAAPRPRPPRPRRPRAFESAARRAQAAREAARDAEAIAAYQAALAQRPEWDEGLWYLGTLLYQSGRREEADAVFARFLKVKPQAGPGWVLRGFCAFEDGDYKSAADAPAPRAGTGPRRQRRARRGSARLRLALSLVKTYDFELAHPAAHRPSRAARPRSPRS